MDNETVKKDAISWIEEDLAAFIGTPELSPEQTFEIQVKAREDGIAMAAALLEKTEASFEYLKSQFPQDQKFLEVSNRVVFAATILINHHIGHLAGLSLADDLTYEQTEMIKLNVLIALRQFHLLEEYYRNEETEEFVQEARSKIHGIISRT